MPNVMPMGADACLCPKCLKAEIVGRIGDCFGCAYTKTLKTKSGSAIFQCGHAEKEPAYAKYPRLPMRGCPGVKLQP